MGAAVLSFSPANAASGSNEMTAAAINELEIFMNSPEQCLERDEPDPSVTRTLVTMRSWSRHSPRRSHEFISAMPRNRDIDQPGDVVSRQSGLPNYNRPTGGPQPRKARATSHVRQCLERRIGAWVAT